MKGKRVAITGGAGFIDSPLADELGSFLRSVRKQLSKEGSLVFHTFPTQYDYLFFGRTYLRLPLVPFRNLSIPRFNRVVKAYASLVDIAHLFKKVRLIRKLSKSLVTVIPPREKD